MTKASNLPAENDWLPKLYINLNNKFNENTLNKIQVLRAHKELWILTKIKLTQMLPNLQPSIFQVMLYVLFLMHVWYLHATQISHSHCSMTSSRKLPVNASPQGLQYFAHTVALGTQTCLLLYLLLPILHKINIHYIPSIFLGLKLSRIYNLHSVRYIKLCVSIFHNICWQ